MCEHCDSLLNSITKLLSVFHLDVQSSRKYMEHLLLHIVGVKIGHNGINAGKYARNLPKRRIKIRKTKALYF